MVLVDGRCHRLLTYRLILATYNFIFYPLTTSVGNERCDSVLTVIDKIMTDSRCYIVNTQQAKKNQPLRYQVTGVT